LEEKKRSEASYLSALACGGKYRLEISDYPKSTHLLKAFLQIRLHGIEHATLDQGRVIRLSLVDILFIGGGTRRRYIAYGGITNIAHPMGCKEDPQSAELSGKFEPSVLSFSFSRNAPRLKVGRDIYKWICKET
jgi:hypothetical protein